MIKCFAFIFLIIFITPIACFSQTEPLRIKITDGVIEPVPLAIPKFLSEIIAVKEISRNISSLIAQDLTKTGLFRIIPDEAHISRVTNFKASVSYSDWKAINAQGLISGAVTIAKLKKQLCLDPRGCLVVKFKLFDIYAESNFFENGQKIYAAEPSDWRRLAHKIADDVYFYLTGELGYFNTKVAFISESGLKNNRLKRLAIMDYDGANVEFLTDHSDIVLTPRFSPDGTQIVYTSFKLGEPHVFLMDLETRRSLVLDERNQMSFSPQFSPDGESMRKAFLRNPLDVFRISSNFNPRRRHPILNTIRAHKGTDYAAPNGTPIRATGDGRIRRASRYGSFGNLVIIEHAGGFETKYAHLSRYHKNTKQGTRVRQGDVIGYVGSTGGATGPHLHYEVIVNGKKVNSQKLKLPSGKILKGEERKLFETKKIKLDVLKTEKILGLN